jgi:hypothetical protein
MRNYRVSYLNQQFRYALMGLNSGIT